MAPCGFSSGKTRGRLASLGLSNVFLKVISSLSDLKEPIFEAAFVLTSDIRSYGSTI